MITLHLLEYLKQNGFGTAIDTDLHFEKLPLDKNGIAIYSVGGERPYGPRGRSQLFELECRHATDDRAAMDKLEKIAEHLSTVFVLCDLPIIPDVSNRQYIKCRIVDMGNIQNLGLDSNDRVIFKLTARISYIKEG